MSNKVSLDKDILPAVGFLFQNKLPTFLYNMACEIPDNQISAHIASLIGDSLTADQRNLFSDFVSGKNKLSSEDEKTFRYMGMLVGKDKIVPKAIREYFEMRTIALDNYRSYISGEIK